MASANRIGRPKKNVSVNKSDYLKIVDKPKKRTSVIEFTNTEPFNMGKYFRTLKSNRISEFIIECRPTTVIFWGKMMVKQLSPEYISDSNNYMYLKYDCTKIYRYFCKRDTFISITDKESIINLLGEIGESIHKIKMEVSSNFGDRIDFTISNSTLLTKDIIPMKCNIEFDQPMRIPSIKFKTRPNEDLYCSMYNIDIGEFKKNLSTKFKKKVVQSKIKFTSNTAQIEHTKSQDKKIDTIFKVTDSSVSGSEQIIHINVKELVEMNFPKQSIVNFLLHIKGHFTIRFYRDCILLIFHEDNATLISELSIDST